MTLSRYLLKAFVEDTRNLNRYFNMMIQAFIHYFLHLVFPGIISWYFFNDIWKKAWVIFLLTMAVDLDHLVASPIFDAQRCSIGFHMLHSYTAICGYGILYLLVKKRVLKIAFLGLIMHMATDFLDCLW